MDVRERILINLVGLPGVHNITDDICISRNDQSFNKCVIVFLDRCIEIDLHINLDKFKLNKESVPFSGNVKHSKHGLCHRTLNN